MIKSLFIATFFFLCMNTFAIVGMSGGTCSAAGGALGGFSSITGVQNFSKTGSFLSGVVSGKGETMNQYRDSAACGDLEETSIGAQIVRCRDGSVSYKQPASENNGYTGYCGETAASNVLHMACQRTTDPVRYVNRFTTDITPGTRPDSLEDGLNDMFEDQERCPNGNWQLFNGADNAEDYISHLVGGLGKSEGNFLRTRPDGTRVRRSPFPILIAPPPALGTTLHWVTVVDVEGYQHGTKIHEQENCKVVINHWNDQFKVPCNRLATWARMTGDRPGGTFVGRYPRLKFFPTKK